jgi:hypothetical protein
VSNPVLISDLEARFRPLTDAEKANAQALLDDAWAIANVQVPMLASSLDSGAVQGNVVRAVVSAMVLRVLRNPEGWVTEAVDDWSGRRGEATGSGALYLSSDELALIGASIGRPRRGAFSITPGGGEEARASGSEWVYGYSSQWDGGYLR